MREKKEKREKRVVRSCPNNRLRTLIVVAIHCFIIPSFIMTVITDHELNRPPASKKGQKIDHIQSHIASRVHLSKHDVIQCIHHSSHGVVSPHVILCHVSRITHHASCRMLAGMGPTCRFTPCQPTGTVAGVYRLLQQKMATSSSAHPSGCWRSSDSDATDISTVAVMQADTAAEDGDWRPSEERLERRADKEDFKGLQEG